MRRIYTVFLYLAIPFIVLRLYWKGRKQPAYRQRILERFSLQQQMSAVKPPVHVWVHAVSLGEVIAVTPLIDTLLEQGYRILITTMTATGSKQVLSHFGEKVLHQYVPYDLPWCICRFYKTFRPKVGLIMETELWPNLIFYAKKQNISLLLINARVSDPAFKQYHRVKIFFKPILNNFYKILTQSDNDTHKYIALGADPKKTLAFGNIKFDLQLQHLNLEQYKALPHIWGKDRVVFIAASTHEDEERQILTHFHKLKAAIPNILILIAPRHPPRFQSVYSLCQALGFKTARRSDSSSINTDIDILVIDSLGELMGFYALSDYAFVGGSLVPIGGHNVLEPIALNIPVLTGLYMSNSKSICQELRENQAMQMHVNAEKLIDACIELHENKVKRVKQIAQAKAIFLKNQGSMRRYLEQIVSLL